MNAQLQPQLRRLRNHLLREQELYRRYCALLLEQRECIKSFQIQRVQDITLEREGITRELQESHAERLLLVQQFPDSEGKRLTDLILAHANGEQKSELLSLAKELKGLVSQARELGMESNQVVQFASDMIHGSISLLWQATQSVSKSYTRMGGLSEQYIPRVSRTENLLKEA
jgi:hypothetical protein